MTQQPGIALAVALVILLVVAVTASFFGRLHQQVHIAVAAGRALIQLSLVSLVIAAVLSHVFFSALFALLMFGVAVFTTSRRVGAPRAWPWAALAMACGLVPVLTVIFVSGAVPLI